MSYLIAIPNARFVAIAVLAALTTSACSEESMMGDFKYACERGWGFFDGWTCQAPLVNNLILHVDENGKGPTIHVDLGEGASARLIPASGDSEVVAVGFDDRLLAAETNAGEWFYLIFGQRAAGQNWPNVVGPFSKVDLDAELFPEKVPRMRRTGATDD